MKKVYSYKGIPWSYQPVSTDRVWLGKEVPEIVILSGNNQSVWTYDPVQPIVFDYSAFGDGYDIYLNVDVGYHQRTVPIDGPYGHVYGLNWEIDEVNHRVTIWSDYVLDDGDFLDNGYLTTTFYADPAVVLSKNNRVIAKTNAKLTILNSWGIGTETGGPRTCSNPGLSLRLSRMFCVGISYENFDDIRNLWTFGVDEQHPYYYTNRARSSCYFGDYPCIEIWNGTSTGTIPQAEPEFDYGYMYYNTPWPESYTIPYLGLLWWRDRVVMSEEFKNSKPTRNGPYPILKE